MEKRHIYSVSEITRDIKTLLEDRFPVIWVQGEISNFKRHFSGHSYFSLKDENAQVACVLWKGRSFSLQVPLQDGLKIMLRSAVTLYEKQGKYQLDVEAVYPLGTGELQLAFEALKNKLLKEGLFDSDF